MNKAPAFQFYASDFLTDTQSWEVEEVGIYMRLLANQWVNFGLPTDEKRLARVAGCDIEMFKKAWVIVGLKFALCSDNLLRNNKLEGVRYDQEKFRLKQQENGKKGGRPPKQPKENPDETQNKPNEKPKESSSSSSSSSINNIEREKEPEEIFKEVPTGEVKFSMVVNNQKVYDLKKFVSEKFQILSESLQMKLKEKYNERVEDFESRVIDKVYHDEDDFRNHFNNFMMKQPPKETTKSGFSSNQNRTQSKIEHNTNAVKAASEKIKEIERNQSR